MKTERSERSDRFDDLRGGVGALWESVAHTLNDGWLRLREVASTALTRFRSSDSANLPPPAEVDDAAYRPTQHWAMLGGDVFEDEHRIVVRLEVPGMDRQDFDLQVVADTLVVRGEKRFERETTEGRWRVLQCAYGSFQRRVPLPVAVLADQAQARYRDGVLRIELPKAAPGPAQGVEIRVD